MSVIMSRSLTCSVQPDFRMTAITSHPRPITSQMPMLSDRSSQEVRFVHLAGGTGFSVEGISVVREIYQRCFV